ncbi:MAG: STAS domain-containing protein [Deltaproteobacteria bacterium]|nr:STAS domain-containing protein [Deltaproteobacteria bacterium]
MDIVELKKDGESLTLALKGRLDAISADDFSRKVAEATAEGARHLLVEMSDLDYISSAGLRVILTAAKQLKKLGGELKLAALQENVATVFKISGFDKIIPILPTCDDA